MSEFNSLIEFCKEFASGDARVPQIMFNAAIRGAQKEFTALEARLKELEEVARQQDELIISYQKTISQQTGAIDELARLKAQDDIGVVNYKNELHLYAHVIEEGILKAGDKIYAEPRPAVLPPEKTLAEEFKAYDWAKKALAMAKVEGYNECLADALVLGCQPQRFVVKNWPQKERIHNEFDDWRIGFNAGVDQCDEVLKAAGGEIAE